MHDNTNVTLKESSDATQHEATRSEHCKECCAKGGDASQPCGWNRGMHLCMGNSHDSFCIMLTKTLEQQKVFKEHCLDDGLIRHTMHIFDKGCRLSLEVAKLD